MQSASDAPWNWIAQVGMVSVGNLSVATPGERTPCSLRPSFIRYPGFPPIAALLMMIADIPLYLGLYLAITWVVDLLKSGQAPRPRQTSEAASSDAAKLDSPVVESVPVELAQRLCVSIRGLKKSFATSKGRKVAWGLRVCAS